MSVWAVDPGNTTGVAVWSGGKPYTAEVPHTAVFDYLNRIEDGDEVVCEDFIISARTISVAQSKWPLWIAGWLLGRCALHDNPFKLQTPAQAKRFATDDKLKRLGWYTPSKGGHANDAIRHLVVFLAATKRIDPSRLVDPNVV